MASSPFLPRMPHQIKMETLFGCGWDVESTLLDYEKSKVPEQWNTLINQNPHTFLALIYYHDTSPSSHF
jgi:hypothetical protein